MSLPAEILQGILARVALALLRIYLGAVLLVTAAVRLQSDFTPELERFIREVALERSPAFYRDLLQEIVLPNAALFGWLLTWGVVLVGALLVVGLLTRLSAAATLLLALNALLAKAGWRALPSSDAAYAAISLALIVGAAGRTWGLDAFLAKRWTRSPFW
jgi:thiosulfate dehydrogenase [quinone] large subunit